MSEKKFVQIGYTKKTHGLGGELKVNIDAAMLEDFIKTELVFLEERGSKTPYFIEKVRIGNEVIVKFEDVNVKETAQNLTGKAIFLRESDVLEDSEREMELPDEGYGYCLNFILIDKTVGEVGKIEDILDMPAQQMAVVEHAGRQVYVPLIPQFIEKVDKKGRKVFVNLPEGLLEL